MSDEYGCVDELRQVRHEIRQRTAGVLALGSNATRAAGPFGIVTIEVFSQASRPGGRVADATCPV